MISRTLDLRDGVPVAPRWSRPVLLALFGVLAVWLWVTVPLALGERTLYMRDVFGIHLPLKAFGAEQLRLGRVPAFDPQQGSGQAFRGNPNAVSLYPGNLLYLVLPFWSAFNLHFMLHWLLAFVSMFALARRFAQPHGAALIAAIAYAGGGYLLTALTFYNLLVVAAWWPLVMLGAHRGGRRGIALAGLACGLALLGGEPVTAALGLVPLGLVAWEAHGWRRGLAVVSAIAASGAILALPQIVATARVLGFTFRGAHGAVASAQTLFALHPLRLLELVLPLPFGWPGHVGPHGWWAFSVSRDTPFVFSLYVGSVALWLAVSAGGARRRWFLLALAGLLFAWLAGAAGDRLLVISGGRVRYPEKFLFWWALSAPLLAGWGWERLRSGEAKARGALVLAGAAILALGAVALLRPPLLARAVSGPVRVMLAVQSSGWMAALAAAAAAWLIAALLVRQRLTAWMPLLALATVLPLAPLLLTQPTAPFRATGEWLRLIPPAATIVDATQMDPKWFPSPGYQVPDGDRGPLVRARAEGLAAASGALQGLRYPWSPDVDGMASPLHTFMLSNLGLLDGARRGLLLRAAGVEILVAPSTEAVGAAALPPDSGLRELARATRLGVVTRLLQVENPAPAVWWPDSVRVASGPAEALRLVLATADPVRDVVLSSAVAHFPGGSVRLVDEQPDRLEIESEGPGGVAVLRREYQPLLRARDEEGPLVTVSANVDRLAVAVRPGHHRIVIGANAWPELLAALVSVVAAALLVWVLFDRRSPPVGAAI
ncbi:MAG: hypothetical protein ABI609_02645 [Acidobacteriota bacterium]